MAPENDPRQDSSEVEGASQSDDKQLTEDQQDQAVPSEGGPADPADESQGDPAALLEKALEEADRYRDMALRAEAEMQNMQRRTARDVENAHKFGLERFIQNLLPVVDSLEKAIEVTEQTAGEGDPMAEGIRLCHKLLIDVLAKENVEVLDPIGAPFDPQEHQAMSMVENPDMEPNSVFAVVQKGYKLNDRLVRAAMVMVTKAPSGAADSQESE